MLLKSIDERRRRKEYLQQNDAIRRIFMTSHMTLSSASSEIQKLPMYLRIQGPKRAKGHTVKGPVEI